MILKIATFIFMIALENTDHFSAATDLRRNGKFYSAVYATVEE